MPFFLPSQILRNIRVFATLLVFSTYAAALEPPTPEQLERYRQDGTLAARVAAARNIGNQKASPFLVTRAVKKIQSLVAPTSGAGSENSLKVLPPGEVGMPSRGTVNVLALLIDFSDYPHSNSQEDFESILLGDGSESNFPQESLRNFYRRSSLGQLEIQGSVLGWYRPPYPRNSIAETDNSRETLIKSALSYYDAQGHDFSKYDNNNDGYIDYLVVFWSGPHGEWAEFWWGYNTSMSYQDFLLDGKRLSNYSWQWESWEYPGSCSPDVVIHETGHALGLPDYYDYDDSVGPRGGVGGLDQMDGNWGDHNCFSKWLLDWIEPVVYTQGGSVVSQRASGVTGDAAIVVPAPGPSQPFAEFFMVQNRMRTANDSTLPNDGLLVWHVDARLDESGLYFRYNNSYTSHKLLRLMEADGRESIEHGFSAGASDFYNAGKVFGPAAFPSSSLYNGYPTGLGIRDISAAGNPMSFLVFDTFSDQTPPVGAPTPPTGSGGTAGSPNLVFQWSAGTAADPESGIAGYYLQVGSSPGLADFFQGCTGARLSASVEDGENGKTYYARVCAMNGNGMLGPWSGNSAGLSVNLPSISGQALDASSIAFTLSGSPWFEQSLVTHSGGSSLQSGPLPDAQQSAFYASFDGPVMLSFFWKVSSEANYDFLKCTVDGQTINRISGEVDWTRVDVPLGSGTHRVKWVYAKDEAVTGGLDTAWVDTLTLSPVAALAGDLDQTQSVNAVDLAILSNFLVGSLAQGQPPFTAALSLADLNHSGGTPDATDLALLGALLAD